MWFYSRKQPWTSNQSALSTKAMSSSLVLAYLQPQKISRPSLPSSKPTKTVRGSLSASSQVCYSAIAACHTKKATLENPPCKVATPNFLHTEGRLICVRLSMRTIIARQKEKKSRTDNCVYLPPNSKSCHTETLTDRSSKTSWMKKPKAATTCFFSSRNRREPCHSRAPRPITTTVLSSHSAIE